MLSNDDYATDGSGDPDSEAAMLLNGVQIASTGSQETTLPVNGVQVDRNKYTSIQRNAARTKDSNERLLLKPVVIRVMVNNVPVRALIDSGSLGDFMSATVADQLNLKRTVFDKALGLQLAVQGS